MRGTPHHAAATAAAQTLAAPASAEATTPTSSEFARDLRAGLPRAEALRRMGFADEVDRITELFRSGRKEEAAAAVPDEMVEATAIITPSGDAVAGDYMVTLTAEQDGQQSSTDIRFTVETSRWWGLAGILLIVAVGVGLWYVFRVYGRR